MYYVFIATYLGLNMSAVFQQQPLAEVVLAKAVLNASKQLGLKQVELAKALGKDRTAISRWNSNPWLSPESKTGELALLLVRVARALFTLTDGDMEWMKHFMRTPNLATGAIPAQQIQTVQGMVQVLGFVDAMRGKV